MSLSDSRCCGRCGGLPYIDADSNLVCRTCARILAWGPPEAAVHSSADYSVSENARQGRLVRRHQVNLQEGYE